MNKIKRLIIMLFRSTVGYPVGYEVVIDEGSEFAKAGTVVGRFQELATGMPVYNINVGKEGKKRKDTVLEGIEESRLIPYSVSDY